MDDIKEEANIPTPDESTAVPNDYADKYMRMFSAEQNTAVLDLIRQSYKAGLEIGRNEAPLFAVIPMSILENENLSANAKLLYAEITALSKKSGRCYATNSYLGKVLGLSGRTIPELLSELSGCGLLLIDVQRSSRGTYRNITVSYFNDGGYRSKSMGGIAKERGQKRNRQIEINKVTLAETSSAEVDSFDSLKELDALSKHERDDLSLIGWFLKKRSVDIRSKEQLSAAIKRHLRAAKELAKFDDTQIGAAAEKAEKEYPRKWTLETLTKILTK